MVVSGGMGGVSDRGVSGAWVVSLVEVCLGAWVVSLV